MAGRDGLPFGSLADVMSTPAPYLFAGEVMADALDRLDRKREIKQAIAKAQARFRGRRG